MKEIYVVNGYPDCGKTTFGNFVGERLRSSGINFIHTSSIDPIKQILQPRNTWNPSIIEPRLWDAIELQKRQVVATDWDGQTKDVFWRGAMSKLKLQLQETFPVLIHGIVVNQILKVNSPGIAFVDIREPENIDGFKKYCRSNIPGIPVKALFIRSNHSEQFDNVSDAGVEKYTYDITIDNPRSSDKSLDNLHHQVELFCLPLVRRLN